ncbi:MFS transporter [Gordonia sp. DT218]|uniref:MFS transporter n=1 Tax=Gordonia sp. DT218 TaxID=3416659 RepID=UPI003CF4E78A
MSLASEPSHARSTVGAGWTPRLVLSLFSIVMTLEILAVSYAMVSVALPQISAHYQTAQGAWMLTAFLLVGAISGPILGKLADMYGKRKLLLIAMSLAAIGSLICAIAPNYSTMIAGRALSGVLAPCVFLGYSLVRDVFPEKITAVSVSIITSGLGLVAVPSPFLSGWLIDNFGFRSIFWFFVIGLIVCGALIMVSTTESAVRLRSRLDLIGAALLGGGIAGVLVAISFGPTWGWTDGSTLGYLIVGIVLLGAWLFSATVIREPLIELSILRNRAIGLTAFGSGVAYGCSALFSVLLPMLVMTPAVLGLGYGFGIDAESYALFLVPNAACVVIGGIVAGNLVARGLRPRMLMISGLAFMALGFLLVGAANGSKPMLMFFAGVAGLGMGFAYSSVPNLLIEAVPPQMQATSASVVNVAQNVVAAILPVAVFAVLNNSFMAPIPKEMVHGATFYTDGGISVAFWIGAGVCLFGALAAILIPRTVRRIDAPPAGIVNADEPAANNAVAGATTA